MKAKVRGVLMRKLAFIGVGNMAKAIIGGIQGSSVAVSQIFLYDKNTAKYYTLYLAV